MVKMENKIEKCDHLISSLTQEIVELNERYRENTREIAFHSSAYVKKTLLSFQGTSSNDADAEDGKTTQTKPAHYEMEIQFFKAITGIEFTKYCKKTEHKTDTEVLYNHKLAGLCRSFSYEMEFKTLESESEGRHCCNVTYVSIHMDCKKHSDLLKLVSSTEKSMNLLGFFCSLSKYAEWYEYRKSTFTQIKEKYPLAVGLPLGSCADCLVLMNPELPGFELMLVWKITINGEGAVIPVLDLLPHVPEQAALDKTGVLESAALGFKTLLQVFGIQGSIENIIQSFCLTKASD
ncbi:centromere protein P isoform X2 [Pseudophryne corroboree]|uniref:centromere protein P isoform X2 n=1 Tax=Pseudophryne corroboree TaxID=495146 RepID=UPI003081911C